MELILDLSEQFKIPMFKKGKTGLRRQDCQAAVLEINACSLRPSLFFFRFASNSFPDIGSVGRIEAFGFG